MTTSMDRMARLTRAYAFLLIGLGIAADVGLLLIDRRNSNLLRLLTLTTVFNALPGVILWYLSVRMLRVELWAFVASAAMALILPIQFLMSAMLIDIGIQLMLAFMLLRIPLVYLLAAYINALPEVIDGYRNIQRDKQMMKRAFEPIMERAQTGKAPPSPTQRQ